MVGIFATVFQVDTVGPDDDFFALGGDSLSATELVSEIERLTGVSLSISILMSASTPRLLAEAITDQRRENIERILIPVRTEGRGPTLFSIHGMGGDDLFTHRLAEDLGQDRPIWTFRAKGVTAGEHPVTSIEAMADLYLAAIRTVQPEGPYLLMGHCGVGTFAAWEVAQNIIATGGRIAGLILMEPPEIRAWAPALHYSGLRLETEWALARRAAEQSSAWIEENPKAPPDLRRKHFDIIMSAATAVYVPRPIQCPTLLIARAPATKLTLNPRNGYQTLLSDARVFTPDGTHVDVMEDRRGESIQEVRAFLDRVAPLDNAAPA